MIRKIFATLLLCSYLGMTGASALYLHYCEGHWMTDLDMMAKMKPEGHEGCPQKNAEKDCCKHPKWVVKASSHQIPASPFTWDATVQVKILPGEPINLSLKAGAFPKPPLSGDSPPGSPPWNTRQAFYGVFLI
ncbi:MAG: hypothetical protein KGM98_15460 [Bacteroidota bacterium]|nr:hypothetical protein [Bacteroidota bacterium]